MSAERDEANDPVPAELTPLPGEPEAIFIVGASRSGTSLLRHLLERSPRIALARENHFLGHLRASEGARYYFRRAGDLSSDDTMRAIVDMIYSGEYGRQSHLRELSTYWKWLVETIPRDEMEARLLSAERTERGLFTAFLRAYADHRGRAIMGEKTPAHVAYVDTLLEWYPNGRVVHMLRDPRAVYVSDLRRRRGKLRRPYSWLARVPGLLPPAILLQTAWVWSGAYRRAGVYAKRYPDRYKLVRFEDLVREPDRTLRAIYAFLGVAMPDNATDVSVVSSGFQLGQHGVDAGAADRWREHIGSVGRHTLELLLRRPMKRAGYL